MHLSKTRSADRLVQRRPTPTDRLDESKRGSLRRTYQVVKRPRRIRAGKTDAADRILEPTGFEPATSWLQTRRSPN